jgi:hypothetical protein
VPVRRCTAYRFPLSNSDKRTGRSRWVRPLAPRSGVTHDPEDSVHANGRQRATLLNTVKNNINHFIINVPDQQNRWWGQAGRTEHLRS